MIFQLASVVSNISKVFQKIMQGHITNLVLLVHVCERGTEVILGLFVDGAIRYIYSNNKSKQLRRINNCAAALCKAEVEHTLLLKTNKAKQHRA